MTALKKLSALLIALFVLSALSLLTLGACDSVSVDGKYCEYSETEGRVDKESWIELKNGEWGNSAGRSGRYELSGENITLFVMRQEEEIEYLAGILKGGEMTFEKDGSSLVYCRD